MTKSTFWGAVLFVGLFATGCQQQGKQECCAAKAEQEQAMNEQLLIPTLYHQRAAEVAALSYQAYNSAKASLDQLIAEAPKNGKPLAIVTDVDETVLDNSPFEAKCVEMNCSYTPEMWDEWCAEGTAKPIKGAVEFFKYAAEKGITTYYITNRKDHLEDITVKNLQDVGFPFADEEHVLPRTAESNKEGRRQMVAKDYNIIMFCGDVLPDFSEEFEGLTSDQRFTLADSLRNEFGRRFIVLPNVMYGDWLNALDGMEKGMNDNHKKDCMKNNLQSY